MPGRIAIFHAEGNFDNNPHLAAVLDRLCRSGHTLDLHVTARPFEQQSRHPNLRLHRHRRGVFRKIYDLAGHGWSRWLGGLLCRLWFRGPRPALVIGVDPKGLVTAACMARHHAVPCMYFSYEIYFADEVGAGPKQGEIHACRSVVNTVVQDTLRGGHLARENGIDPGTMIYMPVAAAGPGVPRPGWLRERLAIPSEKKIAVFMGSTYPWTGFPEVLASVASWPNDWCLVVHNRYGMTPEGLQPDHPLLGRRIHLTGTSFATNDELGALLGDADLGLAFYRPDYATPETGKNLEFLGRASGKVSTFLRFGVPVMVNPVAGLADEVREHGIGQVIEDLSLLPEALRERGSSDEELRRRCRAYFDRFLDVNRTGAVLFARIDELCATAPVS